MTPTYRKEKLFILSMVLWGIVQLASGLFILVSEMGYKGHNLSHNKPLVVLLASSASYMNAGMCTIAFTYFCGKAIQRPSEPALMVPVVLTFALSIAFDFPQFIFLLDSHHGKICLGIIFKVLFLFVFKEKCRTSTPAFVHLKEDTDSLPPPPPAYDNLEKKSNEAITPPPVNTIVDWTRYQANINLAWQGEC